MYLDRMSTLADISCISNVSMIQTTHLNETSSTTQNRKSTDEFETTVESIDLTKSTSDLFLDGCKVQWDVCLSFEGGGVEFWKGREKKLKLQCRRKNLIMVIVHIVRVYVIVNGWMLQYAVLGRGC